MARAIYFVSGIIVGLFLAKGTTLVGYVVLWIWMKNVASLFVQAI